MRPMFVAAAAGFLGLSTALPRPVAAEDCHAERYAAAAAIQHATDQLEVELGPYEAAVITGDIRAFDDAAQWVVGPWEHLIGTITRERARLRAVPCPLDDIPDVARLPAGWDTVRDIGAWQVVEVDRNIALLNAGFRAVRGVRAQR
ncbi:MAG: hypothetical protein ABWY78_19570 [Microvirga sp.]